MRTISHTFRRPRIQLVVAAAVLFGLSITGSAQQPIQPRGVAGPGNAPAYLSLGDSYPHGSDGSGFVPHNDNYWTGYPEYLGEILDRPVVNAACPGETTASFLTGDPLLGGPNCLPLKSAGLLHVDYTGSQMEFAENYLATHSRTVLVTLSLGGNDFQNFAAQCQGQTACILAGIGTFSATLNQNFSTILDRIRQTGYEGPIVFVELAATNYNGATAQLQSYLYQAVAPVVAAYGGQMAPVFERFRIATLPYGGDSCAAGLLLTRADGSCDIHPTEAGHRFIASIIAELVPGPQATR